VRDLPRPRGHAALFVLAAIALGTALVLAGAAMDGPLSPQSGLVLAAAAAVGLLAFGIELRHDDHDAAMFGAVAAFCGLLLFGAGALLGRRHHPVAAAGAFLCAAAFVGAFAHLFRLQRARELVPDVLGETFEGVVVETDGVQWAVPEPDAHATAAYPAALEVHLQNAHDGPREVVVHAEPERGLVIPARSPVRLAPLEVGVLTLPVAALPDAEGDRALRLWIEARGGGRRVRRQRRRYAPRRLSPLFRALGVVAALANPLELARVLRAEHGVKLRLTALAVPGPREPRPGTPSFRSLWRAEGSRFASRRAGLVR
jgi:hypothetical protein